jgi:hypothetical protein
LEQLLDDVVGFLLVSGQVLDDPLDGDLLPPKLLLLEAVMQEDGVSLLAGLGEELLFGLGLEPESLDALVDLPGGLVEVLDLCDDGEEVLEGLPVSDLDGSDDEVGLVLQAHVLVDVLEDVDVLFDADLALEYLALEADLVAAGTAFELVDLLGVRPLHFDLDELL